MFWHLAEVKKKHLIESLNMNSGVQLIKARRQVSSSERLVIIYEAIGQFCSPHFINNRVEKNEIGIKMKS